MAEIVPSASVRQNLLSLQSTAELLATTQNRLANGKKVNTALDNPTNFFTAASLDNRAGDINNLLDGIGNGVQVLQAANTGITSLQKLVDTAKSIANQVLQTTIGYSAKANVTTNAPTGAGALSTPGTAADLTNAGTNSLQGQALVFKHSTGTPGLAGHSRQPGQPVQRHRRADHHHGAGFVLQRHQPAERRQPQADLQRNRQVHA